ncbi:hypothetical protein [uncultured Brachyspira sp.]|uniref:hypothetical protein n=1 Tax=uncultured Brachyspira sp. TaxID=221953 RepID=UPI00260E489D|nr:hypothetical protein [uncultured Brachyspira sp.]
MRKFLLMLFLLFSFSFFAYGQDTDVDGTVTVEETYDEFTQITWYEPKYVSDKDSTYFPNISCYAGRQGESNILRLKIMYMGKSWLFIESFYLLYDGVVKKVNFDKYEDYDSNVGQTGNVFEYIDIYVDEELMNFLENFSQGKNTKMRLDGKSSYKDYVVDTISKKAIKIIIDKYKELNNK